MNETNTQKLFEAFHRLYRERNLLPWQSAMPRGFKCDDGWFDLLWNLSHGIEDEARIRGLNSESTDWPQATQVKQKFGSLRFHLAQYTDATDVLIRQAELASTKICEVCEVCGAPALSIESSRRQVKTVCQANADELQRNSSPARAVVRLPVWKLMKD